MNQLPETIALDWPMPASVCGFVTTRVLGDVKDETVRRKLRARLPSPPAWLKQVHGTEVVDAATIQADEVPVADASYSRTPGVVCCVMAADCMPVLLAARDGGVVGAAHAGWRGLAAGVIEHTIDAMGVPGDTLAAYLGPAIGPRAYEVGAQVREAYLAHDPRAATAFVHTRPGHWMLDLYAVARQRLARCGVDAVYGGTHCTHSEPGLFFSYRRDKSMQRMAACIYRL